ncbi:MAG: toll/interleukin-1 receptor domain-containing protein, partial [Bacteroidota bacterium]
MDHVFISHTTADDAFIRKLNFALQELGVQTFVDSRDMSGGDEINVEVAKAIKSAKHFLVVLSPRALNSGWVLKEIEMAEEVKALREADYKLVPILIKGQENTPLLKRIFAKEPVTITIPEQEGALEASMPSILAALGERLPNDEDLEPLPPQLPLEELILELSDPKILIIDTGARRVNATAELIYKPADDARPEVKSKRFNFTAPIGLLETDEIKWYLEDYYLWPTELYQERARTIEGRLPEWGEELYKSIRQSESARNTLSAWEHSEEKSRRRFSILI